MKIKTQDLTGVALDWAVAKCERPDWDPIVFTLSVTKGGYNPSTDWAQGGPIIEREEIATKFWRSEDAWIADVKGGFFEQYGPTPLIAAMRCYVASKLGDEVEIPDELC